MGRAIWFGMFAITFCLNGQAHELDAGLAITDPKLVRPLDGVYGIGQMVPNIGTVEISNKDLFTSKVMSKVLSVIQTDIPVNSSPSPYDGARFNTEYLTTGYARFVLSGIVNRMDRAWHYLDEDRQSCGEIRLIYRLVYHIELLPKLPGKFIDSYLPMTLNLVMRARNPIDSISCASIAKRWLEMSDHSASLEWLKDKNNGPLANIDPLHVDRLEMNIQSERWGASVLTKKDFGGRANYILRVFGYDAANGIFVPQGMEDEVDRDALLNDPHALEDLKNFLLTEENIVALDRGTLKIPNRFLADHALSVAPGGLARSANRKLSDLLNSNDPDVAKAVAATDKKHRLNVIHSAFGFERRLDDITCSGCHQTHSAAGFHFMGIDWSQIHPNNTTQIAGSPHFFGDMPRRRKLVQALAAGLPPDYTRGFAARPLPQNAKELRNTGLFNGWGGHCYRGSDPTFVSWRSCSVGLTCTIVDETPAAKGFGMCLPTKRREIGDPVEVGIVTTSEFDEDTYSRLDPPQVSRPSVIGRQRWMVSYFRKALDLKKNELASHQEFDSTDSTGAFPNGMLRLGLSTMPGAACPNLTGYPEAICAPVAGDGFNKCVADQDGDFEACFSKNTAMAGLRRCNKTNPCRDDYLCVATVANTKTDGACLPPYFMFQFRVDGHPAHPPQ